MEKQASFGCRKRVSMKIYVNIISFVLSIFLYNVVSSGQRDWANLRTFPLGLEKEEIKLVGWLGRKYVNQRKN